MAENKVGKSDTAKREEEALAFWKDHRIFEKTLEKPSPKGEFVFYEGPPTANGKPGIHHLEARTFKDVIPRFRTMQGYHVRRHGGWDTHGLPVELEVEKKLGLNSKKQIEEYGIAAFNKKCRESVLAYIDEWKRFTDRIGFWVEHSKAYYTFNASYMESLWHIVGHVADRGLLYKDYKVVPWCPRCGTALSSHELAQGYADITDISVYAKFKLVDEPDTYLLAWTTTPWTLPGNVALAVGNDIEYVKAKVGEEHYILAKDLAAKVLGEGHEVVSEMKGVELLGKSYESLYPHLKEALPESQHDAAEKAWKVYAAPFVTTDDGTGIVHTAVMYGQDDFELGTQIGLPKHHLVTESGEFVEEVTTFAGMFVRDEETAVAIIKDLAHRNLLFKKEKYTHSYPHCWRCKTALIYYARDSWYIRMSELRDELVAENEEIHWEPEHIRDGRFGEWLREVKDWAISRERYWGTPLPVWQNVDGSERVVVGSVADLKARTKKSGNTYVLMRHGEARSNLENIVSSDIETVNPLTDKGREQVAGALPKLKTYDFDMVYVSPLQRTKETAEMVRDALGLSNDQVAVDERLRETQFGVCNGKSREEYWGLFATPEERFDKAPEGGESVLDVKRRVGEFLYELERTQQGKKILIVAHEDVNWMLTAVSCGSDKNGCYELKSSHEDFFKNAEVRELPFTPLPHNDDYELDLHRPYIDEVVLVSESGEELRRTPEVMDVWFDSGGMPFAQDHYPFENKEWIEGPGYPADFISEAIDQTRGWFYTLHAVGVLMGRGRAYRNVICLGHLLDADGKKMSKSLGNIVEPWEEIEHYGVDTIRMWMCSINAPGEPKSYDRRTVEDVKRKVFTLSDNVVSFYELYADDVVHADADPRQSPYVLDRWMLARTDAMIAKVTEHLESFRVTEPAREIRDHIADLSQWYVRRSRERIKNAEEEERRYALATLRYVLEVLARVLAPFAPFAAEDIYRRVGGKEESVHLASWPDVVETKGAVLADMDAVRAVVTLALEARTKAGIKVRQPLAKLTVKEEKLSGKEEFLSLIRDELNVKEVSVDPTQDEPVVLDTNLTDDLRREGMFRDIVRAVQDMRKKANLSPGETAMLAVSTDENGKALLGAFEGELKQTASLSAISFEDVEGGEVLKLDGMSFMFSLNS